MPSQVTLSSVFRLGLKVLRSTFNYLYLFEHIFLQVQVVCKDDFHYRGSFSKKKKNKKKTSGEIIVCSGLEKVYFIYNWKEMIGNSLTKHWLDMDLKRRKKNGYVDIEKLLQTFSGA